MGNTHIDCKRLIILFLLLFYLCLLLHLSAVIRTVSFVPVTITCRKRSVKLVSYQITYSFSKPSDFTVKLTVKTFKVPLTLRKFFTVWRPYRRLLSFITSFWPTSLGGNEQVPTSSLQLSCRFEISPLLSLQGTEGSCLPCENSKC